MKNLFIFQVYLRLKRYNLCIRNTDTKKRPKALKGGEKVLITIRAARANLGLTRKEAAKLFGIHHETLANYEADSSRVPRSFFDKIERIYGISTDFIYFGREEEHFYNLRNQIKLHA